MSYLSKLLSNPANRIAIVSGEGDCGTDELFTGRRTPLAIKHRLIAERCNGDRWAYAVIEANDPIMCDGYAIKWDGEGTVSTTFPDLVPTKRGGAGRGRKSADGATGLRRRNISIDDASADTMRKLGYGELSQGIRRAAKLLAGDI